MTCEEVLTRDEEIDKQAKKHSNLVIKETEGYFLKMAGDFSRYMLECSDVTEENVGADTKFGKH